MLIPLSSIQSPLREEPRGQEKLPGHLQRAGGICSHGWPHSSPGIPAGRALPPWPAWCRLLWRAGGWQPLSPENPWDPQWPRFRVPAGMLLPAVTAQGQEREGERSTKTTKQLKQLLQKSWIHCYLLIKDVNLEDLCFSKACILCCAGNLWHAVLSISYSIREAFAAKAPFFLDMSLYQLFTPSVLLKDSLDLLPHL